MTATLKAVVDSALMEKVRQVDLSQVRNYLIVRKGWSTSRADNAIEGYYQFLYLTGTFNKVRPPKDIDEVWHRHILHTEQYANDCMNLFGRFIHHRPFPVALTLTSDCENDCESRMKARGPGDDEEDDDDEDWEEDEDFDGDDDVDLDDDDGEDEHEDTFDMARRSKAFTKLSRAVFGTNWQPILN